MRKLIARVFDYSLDGVIAARKVVFSRTLKTADWVNTTIAGGDLAEEVNGLQFDYRRHR